MRKRKIVVRRISVIGTVLAWAFIVLGCPQEDDPPIGDRWRISLNGGKDCEIYAPTFGDEFASKTEFVAPGSVTIAVRNTGNMPTGELNARLEGPDRDIFSLSAASIPNLEPGEEAELKIAISSTDPRTPIVYQANLLVGNADTARKLPVRYTTFAFIPAALTFDPPQAAIRLNKPAAGVTMTAAAAAGKPWFSSKPQVAYVDKNGKLIAKKTGRTIIGRIIDDTNGNLTVTGEWIQVYSEQDGPKPLSATITGTSTANKKKLVIVYDVAPVASTVAGFSIGNTLTATGITLTDPLVNETAKTLTLTLSREPGIGEIGAKNLTLVYDAAEGELTDSAGNIGVSASVPITLTGFGTPQAAANVTRPVTVTTTTATNANYPVTNAVDNSTTTRWATQSSANKKATLELTYSSATAVTKAVIYDYGDNAVSGRIKEFKIEYDAAGEWKVAHSYKGNVIAGSNNGSRKYEVQFLAPGTSNQTTVTSKKFRLNILDSTANDPSIWEFELWGWN